MGPGRGFHEAMRWEARVPAWDSGVRDPRIERTRRLTGVWGVPGPLGEDLIDGSGVLGYSPVCMSCEGTVLDPQTWSQVVTAQAKGAGVRYRALPSL